MRCCTAVSLRGARGKGLLALLVQWRDRWAPASPAPRCPAPPRGTFRSSRRTPAPRLRRPFECIRHWSARPGPHGYGTMAMAPWHSLARGKRRRHLARGCARSPVIHRYSLTLGLLAVLRMHGGATVQVPRRGAAGRGFPPKVPVSHQGITVTSASMPFVVSWDAAALAAAQHARPGPSAHPVHCPPARAGTGRHWPAL